MRHMRNLDTRIAEALANEATKSSVFSDLLIEIDHALPLNSKALEAERVRMVDPPTPIQISPNGEWKASLWSAID